MSAAERRYGDAPPGELAATLGSLRALAELLLETDAGPAALARVHASLETSRTELAGTRQRPYYGEGRALGAHNPLAPRIEVAHADGVTRGTVEFGPLHEGPPGFAHGGFVAYTFDALLGHHNVAAGLPGMTGSLRVRYHRPTPLGIELALEARTGRISERKIVARGELRVEGELLAESEGLFIVPRAGFEAHMQRAQDAVGRPRQTR